MNELDVYRDPVPTHVRSELEALRHENRSLRNVGREDRLAAEVLTASAFALSGVAMVIAMDGPMSLAASIIFAVAGLFGLFKLTARPRTF